MEAQGNNRHWKESRKRERERDMGRKTGKPQSVQQEKKRMAFIWGIPQRTGRVKPTRGKRAEEREGILARKGIFFLLWRETRFVLWGPVKTCKGLITL